VVETFVYESVPTIEEGHYYGPASSASSLAHAPREVVDGPPSKVKVKTLQSQIPLYISPPVTTLNNGSSTVLIAEKRNALNQPSPSPSLQRMAEDSDNPFRPEGRLSHEVEPIVECYKKRPFSVPPGSDFADGAVVGVSASPAGKKEKEKASKSSKNKEAAVKPQDIKLTLTNADGQNSQLEVQHRQLTSPKAGHVEVVHLGEKRKRCGCCSIQ